MCVKCKYKYSCINYVSFPFHIFAGPPQPANTKMQDVYKKGCRAPEVHGRDDAVLTADQRVAAGGHLEGAGLHALHLQLALASSSQL